MSAIVSGVLGSLFRRFATVVSPLLTLTNDDKQRLTETRDHSSKSQISYSVHSGVLVRIPNDDPDQTQESGESPRPSLGLRHPLWN